MVARSTLQASADEPGLKVIVPELTQKSGCSVNGVVIPGAVNHPVISRFVSHFRSPDEVWMYWETAQSPWGPDKVVPVEAVRAHQPQKPKPNSVLGTTPVPAKPNCQVSCPYARADGSGDESSASSGSIDERAR